jgi:hypothetical protein
MPRATSREAGKVRVVATDAGLRPLLSVSLLLLLPFSRICKHASRRHLQQKEGKKPVFPSLFLSSFLFSLSSEGPVLYMPFSQHRLDDDVDDDSLLQILHMGRKNQ